jgi:hypothetical protein
MAPFRAFGTELSFRCVAGVAADVACPEAPTNASAGMSFP